MVNKQTTTHAQINTENKSKWNPISISNKSLEHTSQGCFHLDKENPSHPATTIQEFIDLSDFVKFIPSEILCHISHFNDFIFHKKGQHQSYLFHIPVQPSNSPQNIFHFVRFPLPHFSWTKSGYCKRLRNWNGEYIYIILYTRFNTMFSPSQALDISYLSNISTAHWNWHRFLQSLLFLRVLRE